MTIIHAIVGTLVIVTNLFAGIWGTWCWWRFQESKAFWIILRCGQVALVAQVAIGGLQLALGRQPAELHILYGILPLVVSFIGEQLKVTSADSVLAAQGVASGEQVRTLPATQQRSL